MSGTFLDHATTTRLGRLRTKLGLILFGLVTAFAFAELMARAFLNPHSSVSFDYSTRATPQQSQPKRIEQSHGIDSVIDWSGHYGVRLVPNVRATIHQHSLSKRDINLHINSIGLRYPELGPKRSREFRILVLGDSITFGDYVDESETYTQHLEQMLRSLGLEVRVINAGLPGASSRDEFYHYLEIQELVDPDLVLVGMYLNDSQSSDHPFYAQRVISPFDRSRLLNWLAARITPLRVLLWQNVTIEGRETMEWREQFRAGRNLQPGDMYNDPHAFDFEIYNAAADFGLAWSQDSWVRQEKLFSVFSRTVGEQHRTFATFLLPIHLQVKGKVKNFTPQESYLRMCGRLGMKCFDSLPSLRQAWKQSQEELYYDHCHLTPRGNRILAEALYAWLNEARIAPQ